MLGETLQPGEERAYVLAVAVILTIIATAALARGEAETVQEYADDIATGRLLVVSDR